MANTDTNKDEKNWMDETYRAGRNVDSFIDEAIRTGDYSSLSRQINRVMNEAVDSMHDALLGSSYRTGSADGGRKAAAQAKAAAGRQSSMAERSGAAGSTYRRQMAETAYEEAQSESRFSQGEEFAFGSGHVRVVPDASAKVRSIIGGIGMAANLLLAVLLLVPPVAAPGGTIFFLAAAAIFYSVRRSGKSKIRLVREANKILKLAKGRDVISTEEIASALGMTKKDAEKELRDIIQKGVAAGTIYLDKDATTLMLSEEAYKQYKSVMDAYRQRQKEEKKKAASEARESLLKKESSEKDSSTLGGKELKEYRKMQDQISARKAHDEKVSAETQKILDEGYDFIEHIHQKNDEIPGEEISRKLDRLEKIVTGIFDQVRKNPESAPDLHKLMSYYLPTTRKLVDTYAALDAQHVQGSNIESAKREIEESLDTINDAYEKLFDSFFRQTAWDVGTDVSVMKSMLMQDGLAEDELQAMRREAGQPAREAGDKAEGAGRMASDPKSAGRMQALKSGGAAMAQAPDEEAKR